MHSKFDQFGKRFAVVGTTGAGKTSFAKVLAAKLNLQHIELDELRWSANWQAVDDDIFRERVTEAIAAEKWITDGNYAVVRDIVWKHANTVIWLDYSFHFIMSRLLNRTIKRVVERTELWHGNRETLRKSFFSTDSILLWGLKTYASKKREFDAISKSNEYPHINFIRFTNASATEDWLRKL